MNNFSHYVQETISTGAKIRLVTNALSMKRTNWSALMNNSATVVVSVDSSNSKTMKKLGRGSLKKLTNSLNIAAEEKRKTNNKGEIIFNTVVSSVNLHELSDIILYAKSLNVPRVTMFPVVALKDNPLNLEYKKDEIYYYINEVQNTAFREGIELRLGASMEDSLTLESSLFERCMHPWSYCYIDYEGNIGYCDHLIGHKKLVLGNLRDKPFEEIWNGKEIQKIRQLHFDFENDKSPKEISHCNWCYNRRYVDFEDKINDIFKSCIVSTFHKKNIIGKGNSKQNSSDFLRARDLPHIDSL